MSDKQLKTLTQKIGDLITLCEQLNRENQSLKSGASSWLDEREQLIEKTELARNKVESMITRLKALEQES